MTIREEMVEHANNLTRLGYTWIAIKYGAKSPPLYPWQRTCRYRNKIPPEKEFNIGLITGEKVGKGYLYALDIDYSNSDLLGKIKDILTKQKVTYVLQRSGGQHQGYHIFFLAEQPNLTFAFGKYKLSLLSTNRIIIVAPSKVKTTYSILEGDWESLAQSDPLSEQTIITIMWEIFDVLKELNLPIKHPQAKGIQRIEIEPITLEYPETITVIPRYSDIWETDIAWQLLLKSAYKARYGEDLTLVWKNDKATKPFLCVLHPEKKPSAALWVYEQPRNAYVGILDEESADVKRNVVYVDFHLDEALSEVVGNDVSMGTKRSLSIQNFYWALLNGELRMNTAVQSKYITRRLLCDFNIWTYNAIALYHWWRTNWPVIREKLQDEVLFRVLECIVGQCIIFANVGVVGVASQRFIAEYLESLGLPHYRRLVGKATRLLMYYDFLWVYTWHTFRNGVTPGYYVNIYVDLDHLEQKKQALYECQWSGKVNQVSKQLLRCGLHNLQLDDVYVEYWFSHEAPNRLNPTVYNAIRDKYLLVLQAYYQKEYKILHPERTAEKWVWARNTVLKDSFDKQWIPYAIDDTIMRLYQGIPARELQQLPTGYKLDRETVLLQNSALQKGGGKGLTYSDLKKMKSWLIKAQEAHLQTQMQIQKRNKKQL